MKFLSAIKRGRGDEDDDDLDLVDDPGPDPGDPDEDGGQSEGGLFSKLLGRLRPSDGDIDDMDDAEDSTPDSPDPPDSPNPPDSPEDSSVQVVRLEGVPDVHPVSESGGGMAPSGEQAGKAGKGSAGSVPSPSTGQGSVSPAAETSTQASPNENSQDPVSAPVEEDDSDDGASGGVELSLKDIFEETAKVDEHLKDLADSQDDIRVEDLAGELREFLSELER